MYRNAYVDFKAIWLKSVTKGSTKNGRKPGQLFRYFEIWNSHPSGYEAYRFLRGGAIGHVENNEILPISSA